MAAPASHPAFPRDAWPKVELKRMPHNEIGVLLEFPASPEMVKLGVDVLGFLVEPQRAKVMHENLEDLLLVLGIIRPKAPRDFDLIAHPPEEVQRHIDEQSDRIRDLELELSAAKQSNLKPEVRMETQQGKVESLEWRAEKIAPICHEANRVLTALVKDVPVQPPWNDAPPDMKKSTIEGVLAALKNPGITPEEQHAVWFQGKVRDGWCYGTVKDTEKKTHPALVDYHLLPEGTKAKDKLFTAIVRSYS